MGVTIHFEGHAKGDAQRDSAIAAAKRFAENYGWLSSEIDEARTVLKRVIDELPVDYVGPTRGVQLQPHENSEPVRLEFDRDNFCQDYCKTQFAPTDIHVRIIELLRSLQPFFADLAVIDEGEYYESDDIAQLQRHIDRCFEMMEQIKAERPGHSGPYRLPSGRIIDLQSDA
jgi:hypothetical protein